MNGYRGPPCQSASNGAPEATRFRIPAVTKALADRAASSGDAPLASSAVTAAASEQPAPETATSPTFGADRTSSVSPS